MGDNDTRRVADLDPMGMIYVGHYKHCFILNIHALGFVVSEKIVSCFSYYKPLVDTDARSVGGGGWT